MKNKEVIRNIGLILISVFIIWYVLPICSYYFSGTIPNILMSVILVIWFITMIVYYPRNTVVPSFFIFIIINILFYFANLFVRYEDGNIQDFIKMGIMFWFPIIIFVMYYYQKDYKALNYLYKLCLFCIIVTLLPTLIEVMHDPNSIRMLAYGGSWDTLEDQLKLKSNIGGFAFLYSMVFVMAVFIDKVRVDNKCKILYIVLMLLVFVLIIQASFFIALGLMLLIILEYIINNIIKDRKIKIIIIFMIVSSLLLIVLFPQILYNIAISISNESFQQKLLEIHIFLNQNGELSGDLLGRLNLYTLSIITFMDNFLFGVGGYYYVDGVSIGYHSQLFDDAARYGVFYLINTILLLYYYEKFLIKQFASNSDRCIKGIIKINCLAYVVLLCLNPIYSCSWISLVMFLLFPCYLATKRRELYDK